jgi:hypothetical protein
MRLASSRCRRSGRLEATLSFALALVFSALGSAGMCDTSGRKFCWFERVAAG